MSEWKYITPVLFQGEMLEFAGRTQNEADARAAQFCRQHGSAELCPDVAWDDEMADDPKRAM